MTPRGSPSFTVRRDGRTQECLTGRAGGLLRIIKKTLLSLKGKVIDVGHPHPEQIVVSIIDTSAAEVKTLLQAFGWKAGEQRDAGWSVPD